MSDIEVQKSWSEGLGRPPEECTSENDIIRVGEFSEEMLKKWKRGRDKHGTIVKIDPLVEAMKECIDGACYFMDTYYRIKKLREKLNRETEEIQSR